MARRRAGSSVKKSSEAFRFSKQQLDKEIKEINKNLQKELAGLEMGVARASEILAFRVLDRALELTPIDTGALRKSAFIERLGKRPNRKRPDGINPILLVGYDRNNSAKHAVFVHERVELQHAPPTQAKFLTTAINEEIPRFLKDMADLIKVNKGSNPTGKGKAR